MWCEGDSRAGKPATGRLEIAVNRWPQWWAIQQDRVANGRSPAWASPVTITQEETQWPSEPAVVPPLRGPKTVGILSRDRTTAETLGEACLGRGYAVKMLASEADSLVCDFVRWTARAGETCDPKSLGDRPWIALVDFPRVEDCERLRLLGSAAVLARPFELEELFWQIGQLSPAHD